MTKYRTKEGLSNFNSKVKIDDFISELGMPHTTKHLNLSEFSSFCYNINNWNPLLDFLSQLQTKNENPSVSCYVSSRFYNFLLEEIVEEYNPELEKLDTIIELLKGKQ